MKLDNISSYEIIEMLWERLPNNGLGGGKVFAVVDIEDGEFYSVYEPQGTIITMEENEEVIFTLEASSKSEIISDWVLDEHIIDWDEIQRVRQDTTYLRRSFIRARLTYCTSGLRKR